MRRFHGGNVNCRTHWHSRAVHYRIRSREDERVCVKKRSSSMRRYGYGIIDQPWIVIKILKHNLFLWRFMLKWLSHTRFRSLRPDRSAIFGMVRVLSLFERRRFGRWNRRWCLSSDLRMNFIMSGNLRAPLMGIGQAGHEISWTRRTNVRDEIL